MVGIIVTGHGNLSKGILEAAEMIFGEQDDVKACTLAPNEGPDDLRAKMLEAVDSFSNQEEVIFLVDLRGGTPFNQASALVKEHERRSLVTGLNLPMLIEALSVHDQIQTAHDFAKDVSSMAVEAVKTLPESLIEKPKQIEEKENVPKGSIPPGTVLGDGKIKISLARIDSRLLHGQVATSRTKEINPDRIIVVSDAVSHDELRKSMIIQAAPSGVKAHVIPLQKMIDISKDTRFGNTKAMLLFENPQDALKVIEDGVDIKELNLGSLAHSQGKVYLTQTVSMDKSDYDAFDKLVKMNVKIDVRKVPTSTPENFKSIMEKANKELNK